MEGTDRRNEGKPIGRSNGRGVEPAQPGFTQTSSPSYPEAQPKTALAQPKNRPGLTTGAVFHCGAKGTRTPDPLLAKQMRYQLRHSPFLNRSSILFYRICDRLPHRLTLHRFRCFQEECVSSNQHETEKNEFLHLSSFCASVGLDGLEPSTSTLSV